MSGMWKYCNSQKWIRVRYLLRNTSPRYNFLSTMYSNFRIVRTEGRNIDLMYFVSWNSFLFNSYSSLVLLWIRFFESRQRYFKIMNIWVIWLFNMKIISSRKLKLPRNVLSLKSSNQLSFLPSFPLGLREVIFADVKICSFHSTYYL